MTEYITKKDKNGNNRYYRVTDGRMKVISRAEYEANTAEAAETQSTEVPETEEVSEKEVPIIAKAVEIIETSGEIAAYYAENSKPVEEKAFEIVKGIIESTGTVHAKKIRLQRTKNCVLINYRNCMVCSIVFNSEHEATAVRFMGSTLETRKKASVCEYRSLDFYKDEIIRQIEFIDWWYLSTSKKKAS